MGLDDRRQATGRDSSECPKTVTYRQMYTHLVTDLLDGVGIDTVTDPNIQVKSYQKSRIIFRDKITPST